MIADPEDAHGENDGVEPEDAGKVAVKAIERIFAQWGDLQSQLHYAASLFRFVSAQIDPQHRILDVPDEVAMRFESVCLWVRKVLPQVAPEVREQALKLLNETNAERTIVALHTLGDQYRRRLRFRQSASLFAAMVRSFGMFKIGIDDSTAEMLREEQLQSTKVALGRLSGMLDYAADDLDDLEHLDDAFYRPHYDPRQVDRGRIHSLLQTLESQLADLPETGVKKRLIANVEELKQEVQRPRPRWRAFVGKAVILLAIIADIKTMHPEIGDDILRTIDVVVETVVSGCQASQKNLPSDTRSDGPRHWAMQPKRIEFRDEESTKDGENG